jgi:hypothetical protein
MLPSVQGEHITRIGAGSNVRDRLGAKTLEGLSCSPLGLRAQSGEQGQARADRYSGAQVRVPFHRCPEEARERRRREIFVQVLAAGP